jgi:hypothetical protein
MGIVFRPKPAGHACEPPMRCAVYEDGDGEPGDVSPPKFVRWRECHGRHGDYGCINGEAAEPIGTVWRCDECGRAWTVWLPRNHPASRVYQCYVPVWRRSTRWERRRRRSTWKWA